MLVKDIYNLQKGLEELSEKELPVSTAFKVQRNHKKIAEEFKTAEELRAKLIEKYKEKDLDNRQVQLKKDKLEDFQKDFDELMNQKVNVEVAKIDLSDLEDISIKPKTILLLDIILEEESE